MENRFVKWRGFVKRNEFSFLFSLYLNFDHFNQWEEIYNEKTIMQKVAKCVFFPLAYFFFFFFAIKEKSTTSIISCQRVLIAAKDR